MVRTFGIFISELYLPKYTLQIKRKQYRFNKKYFNTSCRNKWIGLDSVGFDDFVFNTDKNTDECDV